MLLLCWAKPSLANSVGISYGQQDYQVSLPTNSNVSLKPVGSAVSLTLDLGTDWLVDFDYQQWADEQSVNNQFDLTLDIKTFGSGLTYFLNDWSFSTSYSRSEIDTDYSGKRRVANSLTENITASSIGGSVAYGQAIDNWFYSALFSGLYSSWDFDKLEVINNLSGSGSNSDSGSGSDNVSILIREEKSAGNSTSLSASIVDVRFPQHLNVRELLHQQLELALGVDVLLELLSRVILDPRDGCVEGHVSAGSQVVDVLVLTDGVLPQPRAHLLILAHTEVGESDQSCK